MAKNKTTQNETDVQAFLEGVEDATKRADSQRVAAMFEELSGEKPKMWGSSIVGFGSYHYKYDSGREGDFMRIGFSPRKQNLTLYIMPGFSNYEGLLERLGKHKLGKSCLYIKKLADVDWDVLRELSQKALDHMAEKYPEEN